MKKQVLVIGIIILFLTMCCSGCELLEEKDDYITVKVGAMAGVTIKQETAPYSPEKPGYIFAGNALVRIEIVKAGGEREEADLVAGALGMTSWVEATFKLYREQDIMVYAQLPNGYDYEGVVYQGSKIATLPWNAVYPAVDFGETYNWEVNVDIVATAVSN